ncbi:hypothetical protein SERLA73DRAFT_163085 [Serpula lacrymans var. lacrymans S7.3]|uniref:Uncharacterized protein n=1 Tax=Serpula lacrymans var. lacrymans (strain S7.3) TaxID=936435 RepID=F8QBG0_SERL3|nr:hypothetical protein SERLA73DRAFT_163085 [Serpula lacrymans var. lacrymans S7.3]
MQCVASGDAKICQNAETRKVPDGKAKNRHMGSALSLGLSPLSSGSGSLSEIDPFTYMAPPASQYPQQHGYNMFSQGTYMQDSQKRHYELQAGFSIRNILGRTADHKVWAKTKVAYLEDENSKQVNATTVKAIHKVVRSAWSELVHKKLAPRTWGKVPLPRQQLCHSMVEHKFPIFKLANNGWKLEYLGKEETILTVKATERRL